jgi:hypothetical protein
LGQGSKEVDRIEGVVSDKVNEQMGKWFEENKDKMVVAKLPYETAYKVNLSDTLD